MSLQDSKSYQLAEIKISKRLRIGILESVYQFAVYFVFENSANIVNCVFDHRLSQEDCVKDFLLERMFLQELARTAEAAFAGTERRADLDRWYVQLIISLKDGIEYAATSPFSKSPAAVVRFENYHHLYCTLKHLDLEVNITIGDISPCFLRDLVSVFYVKGLIRFTVLKYNVK